MVRYTNCQVVANMIGIDSSLIQEDWIDWATAEVDGRCERTFGEVEVVERQDGTDLDELYLDNSPITSLVKVEYLQSLTSNTWTEVDEENFVIYKKEGKIRLTDNAKYQLQLSNDLESLYFASGVQNWRVTYKYGEVEVPKLVELLATLLVINTYNLKSGGAGTISSEKIGQYSVSYDTSKGSPVNDLIDKLVAKLKSGPGIGALGL